MLSAGALAIYGALAIPLGRRNGFLIQRTAIGKPWHFVLDLLRLLLIPAFVEEVIFRVMLLPHPNEGVPGWRWLFWAALSLVLYVLYHLLLGKTIYRQANDTFSDRRFLVLVGWLGLLLTGLYWITGSLWLIVPVHWVAVVVWIYALGGKGRLPQRRFFKSKKTRVKAAPSQSDPLAA
ncbi:MAG: CPBP family intramembrane metalloprotease [Leptolyngbyaceae cyanobacterium SM2_5_2]|nr:CPBP family intramembrane metalloprotease [Leptolyngbyaceae cyanobacterium SM2_5_2]